MTHFKLYLLTPQFKNNATVFIEDQITEFYTQSDQIQSKQVEILSDDSSDDIQEAREDLWHNGHNTFSYSYNEKLSKEQNAQKTLTFEMNRYIITENEWQENPFARNIMDNSLILLREYNYEEVSEETLFIVTSIKYNFKENNTIYSISCQDRFTYETARQNDGYTIKNDPESVDFIGAKTIDWWIINKIIPECHVNYQYLSMQTGLYLTKQGKYYTFDINEKDNLQVPDNDEILKIVKEPYSIDTDKDYFEFFSFSCSDSNANAALIELADLIDFQLNTFEHTNSVQTLDCYFWVEPKQNDKRLGLEYSPMQSIKNFELTHKSDSLTTVLNVVGPTVNEEVISLIPSIPPFFTNVILDGGKWDNSDFNEGYFTNLCKGRLFMNYSRATENANANIFAISTGTVLIPDDQPASTDIEIFSKYVITQGLFYNEEQQQVCGWFDSRTHYRYFPIYTDTPDSEAGVGYYDEENNLNRLVKNYLFQVPNLYNFISFSYNKDVSFIVKRLNDGDVVLKNNSSHWELVLHDLDSNEIFFFKENHFANILKYHNYRVFIRIRIDEDVTGDEYWTNPSIYLHFYRHPTNEELEFAEIADKCPWLENKLIDFSYFYDNRLITTSEYSELMNILNNQLRIVNGKLLIYAQAYYNALHQETEIIANLQNEIDILGAECQASIIDVSAESNKPALDDSRFKSTYFDIINTNKTQYTSILQHATLLEEYFSKYFNAEQRFLKNIKFFTDFFNAPVNFAAEGLYEYTLSIELPDFTSLSTYNMNTYTDGTYTRSVSFYSFSNAHFHPINNTFKLYIGYNSEGDNTKINNYGEPCVPIYLYEKGVYVPTQVASRQNYKNLYIPNISKGTRYQINDSISTDGIYNNNRTYYQIVFKIPLSRTTTDQDWMINGNTVFKAGITDNFLWNRSPTLWKWRGLYHVARTNSDYFYCIGKEIVINDDTHATLHCIILPTRSDALIPNTWQAETINCTITPAFLEADCSFNELTNFSITNVTISTDYRVITQQEAINNWLYRYIYNSRGNLRYHNYECYAPVTTVPDFFRNYCYKTLVLNFAKFSDTLISYPWYAWDADDDLLYNKYFPETTVYYYGPKYKIEKKDDLNTYYFKRLNKKGEDQGEYYASLTSDNWVENPYNYQEYQPITIVNPDNENNFYRRVYGSVAGQIWSGICSSVIPIAMFFIPVFGSSVSNVTWNAYHTLWKYGSSWVNFSKEGLCNTNFYGSEFEGDNALYSGWHNWAELAYIKDENNFISYEEMKNAAIDNNGGQTYVEFSHWDNDTYRYIASDLTNNILTLEPSNSFERKNINNPIFYPLIGDKVGITYAAACAADTQMYYKKVNGRVLNSYDHINKNTTYKMIIWDLISRVAFNSSYITNYLDSNGCLDLIKFYPLANAMIPVDLSHLDWDNNDSYSLADALDKCGYEDQSGASAFFVRNIYLRSIGVTSLHRVTFFAIEDYELTKYIDNRFKFLSTYPIDIYAADNRAYDSDNTEYNFDEEKTLMKGYFYIAENDDAFVKVSDIEPIPDFDPNQRYYNNNFQQVFTIKQLMDTQVANAYYFQSQIYTEELLSDQHKVFTPTFIKNTALIKFVISSGHITQYEIIKFTTEADNNVYTLDFTYNNQLSTLIGDILVEVSLNVAQKAKIFGLTNGAFWFKYHNNLDHPLLLQQAAVIEAQLSSYWQTAYIASKYCEFFLPEHWQPVYDVKTNNFASALFTITYPENSYNISATISHHIIPVVEVVTNEKNEYLLPRYQFKRAKYDFQTSQLVNNNGQYIDKFNTFLASDVLSNNAAVTSAMRNLNESLDNWLVEEAGVTTYYYAVPDTGLTWPQFLREATHISYDMYSGQYVMIYKILSERYRELPMEEYYKYQKQHDQIWTTLYHKYPGMILQNTYKNEKALTSSELLQMSSYILKNKQQPEAEYSLSVLNVAQLKGYYGQEIRIGDGIKLDAQSYYNEYDQIYKSLSQYLFISKISYALRNPVDISLTVNDVQYEDKIIQRLVKLIR